MTLHNRILPLALVAALLVGGSVGALVTRSHKTAENNLPVATTPASDNALDTTNINGRSQASLVNDGSQALDQNRQTLYRNGFNDGFTAARSDDGRGVVRTQRAERVVYRNAPVRRYASSPRYVSSSRQAYYNYQPRQRSFWQKHRDKLTVAIGSGGGALLGGLIGGKKGAAIGAIGGGAGSALYTYKIRHRNRRY